MRYYFEGNVRNEYKLKEKEKSEALHSQLTVELRKADKLQETLKT